MQRILAWRWRDAPYTEVPDERPGHEGEKKKLWGFKQREFLIKFVEFSFWDVDWVTELQMEIHFPHQVKFALKQVSHVLCSVYSSVSFVINSGGRIVVEMTWRNPLHLMKMMTGPIRN